MEANLAMHVRDKEYRRQIRIYRQVYKIPQAQSGHFASTHATTVEVRAKVVELIELCRSQPHLLLEGTRRSGSRLSKPGMTAEMLDYCRKSEKERPES
eukprot:scaffold250_cov237-Pinguiococcus_pyrenoidosus.AAC.1